MDNQQALYLLALEALVARHGSEELQLTAKIAKSHPQVVIDLLPGDHAELDVKVHYITTGNITECVHMYRKAKKIEDIMKAAEIVKAMLKDMPAGKPQAAPMPKAKEA